MRDFCGSIVLWSSGGAFSDIYMVGMLNAGSVGDISQPSGIRALSPQMVLFMGK